MALRISQSDFDQKVLQADKPVLVDFYSDTCIPCKRMAGPLGDVEETYEAQLHVYKVNVNYDEELAKKYNVMAAPTLIVFVNGEEKARKSGAAGKDEITALFAEYV